MGDNYFRYRDTDNVSHILSSTKNDKTIINAFTLFGIFFSLFGPAVA